MRKGHIPLINQIMGHMLPFEYAPDGSMFFPLIKKALKMGKTSLFLVIVRYSAPPALVCYAPGAGFYLGLGNIFFADYRRDSASDNNI